MKRFTRVFAILIGVAAAAGIAGCGGGGSGGSSSVNPSGAVVTGTIPASIPASGYTLASSHSSVTFSSGSGGVPAGTPVSIDELSTAPTSNYTLVTSAYALSANGQTFTPGTVTLIIDFNPSDVPTGYVPALVSILNGVDTVDTNAVINFAAGTATDFALAHFSDWAVAAVPGTTATISGTLIDTTTQHALAGITIAVGSTGLTGVTDNNGNFSISGVPDGTQQLSFSLDGTPAGSDTVSVTGTTAALGSIYVNTTGYPPPPPLARKV
jgi:hypothetical protein